MSLTLLYSYFLFFLSCLALRTEQTNIPLGIDPTLNMTLKAEKFNPEVLLTLPRRSAGVPNK
jgi:hypothetical protein